MKHSFEIEGQKITLEITEKDGMYTCDIIEGKTGMGTASGPVKGRTLEEIARELEHDHRYIWYFFNKGYNAAKQAMQ